MITSAMATSLKAIAVPTTIIWAASVLALVAIAIRLANAPAANANAFVIAIFRTGPRVAKHANPALLALACSRDATASAMATAQMSVPATHKLGGVTRIRLQQACGGKGRIPKLVPWQ